MIRLVVRHLGGVKEYRLTKKVFSISDTIDIGRSKDCAILLPEDNISRIHAKISYIENGVWIEDNGSSNGTDVNGITIEEATQLKHNDEIQIATAIIKVIDDTSESLVGKEIGGYSIIDELGCGGMGMVYRAKQLSMDRIVALKVLKKKLSENEKFLKQFKAEARIAGKINHPNVTQVYDCGVDDDIAFFSMEIVLGDSLDQTIKKSGALPVARTLEICEEIAGALEVAAVHKIIHRDVKPHNIIINQNGVAKLADLGLAKVSTDETGEEKNNSIVGTPHYMAPELARRKNADERADIYSLGATMFHLLTGRVPFEGKSSIEVINKHIKSPVPDMRDIDPDIPLSVCNLVSKMMSKSPDKRQYNSTALLVEIHRCQKELESKGAPTKKTGRKKNSKQDPSETQKITRKKRRKKTTIKKRKKQSAVPQIIIATVAISILIAVYMLLPQDAPQKPAEKKPPKVVTVKLDKNEFPSSFPTQTYKKNANSKQVATDEPAIIENKIEETKEVAEEIIDTRSAWEIELEDIENMPTNEEVNILSIRSELNKFLSKHTDTAAQITGKKKLRATEKLLDELYNEQLAQGKNLIAEKEYASGINKLVSIVLHRNSSANAIAATSALGEINTALSRIAAPILTNTRNNNIAFKFDDSIGELQAVLPKIAGSAADTEVKMQLENTIEMKKTHSSLVTAIKGNHSKLTLPFAIPNMTNGRISRIAKDNLSFEIREGKTKVKKRFGSLSAEEYIALHELFETDEDSSIGAALIAIQMRDKAIATRILTQITHGELAPNAIYILSQIENSSMNETHTFAPTNTLNKWVSETGNWKLENSTLILNTQQNADLKRKRKKLSGRRGSISFSIQINSAENVFLGTEDAKTGKPLWGVNIGEAYSLLVDGNTTTSSIKPTMKRWINVKLALSGDKMTLFIDNRKTLSINDSSLATKSGLVSIKAKSAAMSVREIKIIP